MPIRITQIMNKVTNVFNIFCIFAFKSDTKIGVITFANARLARFLTLFMIKQRV
jgi:hypothetical protein